MKKFVVDCTYNDVAITEITFKETKKMLIVETAKNLTSANSYLVKGSRIHKDTGNSPALKGKTVKGTLKEAIEHGISYLKIRQASLEATIKVIDKRIDTLQEVTSE